MQRSQFSFTNTMSFRIFISIGLLVLLIVLALGQKSLGNLENLANSQLETATRDDVVLVTTSANNYLNQLKRDLLSIVEMTSRESNQLNNTSVLKSNSEVAKIRLVSSDKTRPVISKVLNNSCPAANLKASDTWPLDSISGTKIAAARFRLLFNPGRSFNDNCFELAIPIVDGSTKSRNEWMIATIRNEKLVQIARTVGHGYVTFYDENARAIARSAANPRDALSQSASAAQAKRIIRAGEDLASIKESQAANRPALLAVVKRISSDFDLPFILTLQQDGFSLAVQREKHDLLLYGVLFLLMALLMAFAIAAAFSSPIRNISHATSRIADGDFRIRLNLDGVNEITTLAGSVNELAQKISELLKKQQDLGRLDAEIKTARLVQETIFPDHLVAIGNRFRASAFSSMANECGGDLWGTIQLPGNKHCIYIADASGHGVSSAFITIAAHAAFSLIESFARQSPADTWGPNQILKYLNEVISEVSRGKVFMSMFIAVIDDAANCVEFANAGHTKPMLISQEVGQASAYRCRSLLSSGTPLGSALPGTEWAVEKLPFAATDKLVLFTDGLIENMQYLPTKSSKRSILNRLAAMGSETGPSICSKIQEQYLNSMGATPPNDDCTVVVLDRNAA